MRSAPALRDPRAFTLIELLTVIAIIGILAAIIIPVTGRVRASARSAKCAANLRQTAQALLLYASNDRLSRFPYQAPASTAVAGALTAAEDNWIKAVAPLLAVTNIQNADVVLNCPNVDPPAVAEAPFTFAMNRFLTNNLSITRIKSPSRMPLLRHTTRTNAAVTVAGDNNLFTFNDGSGQYNVAYADGHVARGGLVPAPDWDPAH